MNKTLKYSMIAVASLTLVGGVLVVYRKRFGISKVARKAIKIANSEFEEWNKGGVKRKEGEAEMLDNLRKYWQEGANTFWTKSRMVNEAWSAAFISYLMNKSGAGENFKGGTSHSVYIRDAIKNRKENNKNPFKGYRPEEVRVKKGDLVCYARQKGVGYDTKGAYKSHCDLIVDIKNGIATGIGGNVSNSVSKTKVELDKDNKIIGKKHFVVIKNKK